MLSRFGSVVLCASITCFGQVSSGGHRTLEAGVGKRLKGLEPWFGGLVNAHDDLESTLSEGGSEQPDAEDEPNITSCLSYKTMTSFR